MLTTAGEIRYLHETPPKGAEVIEMAPGILWARLPLPFRLNHVNVWLLRDEDGWTMIDTGAATDEARAIWDALFKGPMAGARVNRLVATHGHTDHVGLAGWLVKRAGGVPMHVTLAEWMSAQIRYWEAHAPMNDAAERFLAMHGCDAETVAGYAADRERIRALQVPQPGSIERLRQGDVIRMGQRDWRLIVAGGHAIEHTSFWCEADKILIAGDQVLSKISPMIGVFPAEPNADPLAEYLDSLHRFRELPADALVLPSHGLPFTGLHVRVDQLAHHHDIRLDDLAALMAKPRTSMELTHGLFARAVAEGQGRLALAETIAHANYLVGRGRATVEMDARGQLLFERARSGENEWVGTD